jgi:hypothetical protein
MPRMLGRVLLVFAILLAQQTALAHQYWHASNAALSAEAKKAPKTDPLCDFHDLLGTVLGVAGGATPIPAFLALAEPGFAAVAAIVREPALLAAHSRDPPLIS